MAFRFLGQFESRNPNDQECCLSPKGSVDSRRSVQKKARKQGSI